MATKYFDKKGERCDRNAFLFLNDTSSRYVDEVSFKNDKIRVGIKWIGEFDNDIPDEHCLMFRVVVRNKSRKNGLWLDEPEHRDRMFSNLKQAKDCLLQLAQSLVPTLGRYDKVMPEGYVEEEDLRDFGEPEPPKDVPRTKSKAAGSW